MLHIDAFFNSLKDKKVCFIGLGVSHRETVELFVQKGLQVTVCDKKETLPEYETLSAKGVNFVLGENYLTALDDADVIFRTPGMYYNHPQLSKARAEGKAVTSEMEVFFDLCPCKIYAVTGSDGKTTTTTLIAEMLAKSGKTVHKGGNIGRALLPIIDTIKPNDVAVVELSSFQLMSMRKSPDVAVITNITPNHLDVHGTMSEYIDCKKNLVLHQNAFSRTVLSLDNDLARSFSELVRGELRVFTRKVILDGEEHCSATHCGAFLDKDGYLSYNSHGEITKLFHKDKIRIPGIHNVENYLAAIAAVWGEVPVEVMEDVATNFGGVKHRIEFVREINGVKWYNDSIATSPTRVLAGLNSFTQKVIVIAGGYDKKIPFEPMAETVNEKVKLLILMGAAADKIETAVKSAGNFEKLEILHADSMENAVALAFKHSKNGDIVTLSPACASFDMYVNFEARGLHYKELVNKL
jgi:UDP-N-acetylmuramoylalanine--D-glutamate ligase